MRVAIVLFACLAFFSVQAAASQLVWSGFTWNVRNQTRSGPGNNLWAGANSYLDSLGQLHLTIQKTKAGWTCAEIFTTVNFTNGTFEWWVNSRVDTLDKNVVVGLFVYPGGNTSAPPLTNEIDIEFAQWGNASNPHLFYTIWPKNTSLPYKSYGLPMNLTSNQSTHRFTWSGTSVFYEGLNGWPNGTTSQFANWTTPPAYDTLIPTMPLYVHMNVWLYNSRPPSNGKAVDIVFKQFHKS